MRTLAILGLVTLLSLVAGALTGPDPLSWPDTAPNWQQERHAGAGELWVRRP